MESFEHRYILHIGILSIGFPEKHLEAVLKIIHRIFPDKCTHIEIK